MIRLGSGSRRKQISSHLRAMIRKGVRFLVMFLCCLRENKIKKSLANDMVRAGEKNTQRLIVMMERI